MKILNELPNADSWTDAEGFYDLECKKCGTLLFTIQFNENGHTLRIICPTCYEEVDLEIQSEFTNNCEES